MQIDWKRKLTSRKFWLALIGLVSGLLMAFKVDGDTVEVISGVIMSAASVIAYTIGEGLADAANAEPVTLPVPLIVTSNDEDTEDTPEE